MNRSSRPEVFCEKGVLRNFAKFTGKHLCKFAKFLRIPFLTEHLLWLLLHELFYLFILMLPIKLLICIPTAIVS